MEIRELVAGSFWPSADRPDLSRHWHGLDDLKAAIAAACSKGRTASPVANGSAWPIDRSFIVQGHDRLLPARSHRQPATSATRSSGSRRAARARALVGISRPASRKSTAAARRDQLLEPHEGGAPRPGIGRARYLRPSRCLTVRLHASATCAALKHPPRCRPPGHRRSGWRTLSLLDCDAPQAR